MNFIKIVIIALITQFLYNSCGYGVKNNKSEDNNNIKEVYLKDVRCKRDTLFSYALYLPSGYSNAKKWPVIFAFDASARGELAVNLLKNAADKYGYIIVASNSSKNGLSGSKLDSIIKFLFEDVYNQYSINEKRVYTTGFSGGARIASSIAMMTGTVNTVIGCSAGLSGNGQSANGINFNYLGIVGNEDFNYIEMKDLNEMLNQLPIKHNLIVYDGKHDWPNEEIMNDAILWLQFNEMKAGNIDIDNNAIKDFIDRYNSKIADAKNENDILKEYVLNNNIVNYLDGIYDVSNYIQTVNTFKNSETYIIEFNKQESLIQNEKVQQYQYVKYLKDIEAKTLNNTEKTNIINSWQKEMNALKNNNQKNPAQICSSKRLINYIGLVIYMEYENLLKQNKLAIAELFSNIWEIVLPDLETRPYYTMHLYLKLGNNEKALQLLEQAIKLGYKDIEMLNSDKSLDKLRNQEKYKSIIAKINSK